MNCEFGFCEWRIVNCFIVLFLYFVFRHSRIWNLDFRNFEISNFKFQFFISCAERPHTATQHQRVPGSTRPTTSPPSILLGVHTPTNAVARQPPTNRQTPKRQRGKVDANEERTKKERLRANATTQRRNDATTQRRNDATTQRHIASSVVPPGPDRPSRRPPSPLPR